MQKVLGNRGTCEVFSFSGLRRATAQDRLHSGATGSVVVDDLLKEGMTSPESRGFMELDLFFSWAVRIQSGST